MSSARWAGLPGRTPSIHRLETHHGQSRTRRPDAVREHARSGPRAQQGVLREARLQLQSDVHRRDRRLHAGRRARLRHAAEPREVRGVLEAADRRSHHARAGAVLLQRVVPRRGRYDQRRRARGRRHRGGRRRGLRLHVLTQLLRPRRPRLAGHVDGSGGGGAGARGIRALHADHAMNAPASSAVTPVLVADLLAEDERMPVYVHVIDHPDARVLVDTGMTELHPAVADLDPRLVPLSTQDFDPAGIDIVVNTHLHFDHCGGNQLFAARPIYVQRRELDDARSEDDYTIREWVDAPGVRYVPLDGEHEVLPGLRLVPAPGHTRGMQVVLVETGGRPVVVGGDVAVWFGELDEPHTEGQLRVRALDPELVWLAHAHEAWRPRTV